REDTIRPSVAGARARCVTRCRIRQVLRRAVIRIVVAALTARNEDGEEVVAVAECGSRRTAVQPDVLLTVIDVAIDVGVAVLAVTVSVDTDVDGREGSFRNGGSDGS